MGAAALFPPIRPYTPAAQFPGGADLVGEWVADAAGRGSVAWGEGVVDVPWQGEAVDEGRAEGDSGHERVAEGDVELHFELWWGFGRD